MKRADVFNIIRILLYIILVGVPLRYLYDGFGSDRSVGLCIAMFIVSGVIILLLEKLVFSKWRKKLDTFPAITKGSMYQRTTEGYRSAFDVNEPEKENQNNEQKEEAERSCSSTKTGEKDGH